MKARILFVAIMYLCTAVDGYGRTITVDANGSGDYTTIQAAIDDANNADIVQVRPGTYQQAINFLGRNITVTSLDPEDPCVIAATVIDANGLGSVVTFDHNETNQAVLTGFTITGGTGTFVFEAGGIEVYWGGGICCNGSSPAIVRNVIAGNHGPVEMDGNTPVVVSFGGGIVSMAGKPTITRNIIKDNSAYFGAAVAVISGDAKIVSNLIYENFAWFGGGAAPIFGGRLLANTIVENSGQLGGGVCLLSDTVIGTGLVSANIICDSTEGGGLYADSNSLNAVRYNNLHNNTPADYVETPNLTGVGGNISADPCFADPNNGDFHLLPDSPCIDAGDPNYVGGPNETDLDGKPRILDGNNDGNSVVDMGAYEYNPFVARFVIVDKERVGRTLFRYTCKVTLSNLSPGAVKNVELDVVKVPHNMTIIDSNVTFDHIEAWKSATSDNTCSFEVDRSQAIVPSEVIWQVTYEIADTGQAGQQMSSTMVQLELTSLAGDITGDGAVNLEDLKVLAEQWLQPPGTPSADIAPLPLDGIVNFLDFALLAENWLK